MPVNPSATLTGSQMEPVAGFRLRVEIGDTTVGWFTECSGLGAERKVEPVAEGGVNDYVHQLPAGISYSRVILRRGVGDQALWVWFREGFYDVKVKKQNVTIMVYSGDRKQIKRWNLADAFPVKWTGPDLRSDSNQVAVEALELVHHGLNQTDWMDVEAPR